MIYKWYIYFYSQKRDGQRKNVKRRGKNFGECCRKERYIGLYILIYRYLKYLNFLFLVFDLSLNSHLFSFFSALMGVAELAKGIQYDKPIKTG